MKFKLSASYGRALLIENGSFVYQRIFDHYRRGQRIAPKMPRINFHQPYAGGKKKLPSRGLLAAVEICGQ